MTSTKWLNSLELEAWKNLSLMNLQLNALLNKDLATSGLSFQDYLVLATLSDQPDGKRRIQEIGHELGWEKSRTSHHISRMCERGFVSKEKCPSDKRGQIVALTASGRKAAQLAAPGHVAKVRSLFIDVVTTKELQTIGEIASKVLTRLEQETLDN